MTRRARKPAAGAPVPVDDLEARIGRADMAATVFRAAVATQGLQTITVIALATPAGGLTRTKLDSTLVRPVLLEVLRAAVKQLEGEDKVGEIVRAKPKLGRGDLLLDHQRLGEAVVSHRALAGRIDL